MAKKAKGKVIEMKTAKAAIKPKKMTVIKKSETRAQQPLPKKAAMTRPSLKVQEDAKASSKPKPSMTKKEKAEEARPKVRIIGIVPKKVVHVVVPDGKPTLLAASKEGYTKAELETFRKNLEEKLRVARADYDLLIKMSSTTDSNGTDDTYRPMKSDEDSNEGSIRNETAQLAARQEKFITQLENAQLRLKNGTYGICMFTGRLISPERLLLVPHATLSAEAKKEVPMSKGSVTGAPLGRMSKVA